MVSDGKMIVFGNSAIRKIWPRPHQVATAIADSNACGCEEAGRARESDVRVITRAVYRFQRSGLHGYKTSEPHLGGGRA